MKKSLFAAIVFSIATAFSASAQQDKSKRVSPPVTVTETTKKGTKITITYGQPALKGRKIGTDFVPYGKVWRTGANEATVFETDKDVKIKGQTLPAGKYGLYTIPGENEWVVIFNKSWDQWGTKYSQAEDQLRVNVKPERSEKFQEKLMVEISKSGEVSIEWGDTEIEFEAK